MNQVVGVFRRGLELSRHAGRLLSRFGREQEAATAVEFALVSVPFIGLLFAIFETAFVFFATQGVDAAVSDAARLIMTGQIQNMNTITTAAQFRDNIICNPTAPRARVLPSFINCSQLIVDVRTATDFASANMTSSFISDPTHKYCTGKDRDIVVVRVVYPMPVYLSILTMNSLSNTSTTTAGQTNYGGGMKHMILSTAVFRNEPFPNAPAALSGC